MLRSRSYFFLVMGGLILMTGCKAYKQDILFRLDEKFTANDLQPLVRQAESNYQLEVDDYIKIEVFTNEGERLIDPNFELNTQINSQSFQVKDNYQYLIQKDGMAKLPMVGKVPLAGLTVQEAEKILEEAYMAFYKDNFVKMVVNNRRVVVLGAHGGVVLPLENENVSVIEVIGMYGGVDLGAKARNIKLIRGNFNDPEVFMIDLSTISGMQDSHMTVQPGDVIYVEPWRRPWLETLRDLSPVLSLVTSTLTLIVVIQNLTK